MTRLRIAPDGTVRGLWTDEIDWPSLGSAAVERASHVEFDHANQEWAVREGRPRSLVRRLLQRLTGRSFSEILYMAGAREAALAWEREHYGPGGEGWRARE